MALHRLAQTLRTHGPAPTFTSAASRSLHVARPITVVKDDRPDQMSRPGRGVIQRQRKMVIGNEHTVT
eukprot:COSAG01_NODE_21263_length_910_cov_3.166461_1_plen_67_part_10